MIGRTVVLHVGKYKDGYDRLCRHDCLFCIERMEPGKSSGILPTLYDIDRALKLYKKKNIIETIYIAGGEPTLREDFIPLSFYLSNICSKLVLSTSCDYGEDNNKILQAVLNSKIKSISTSVLGINKKIHDLITQSEGSFDRTFANMDFFLSFGLSVNVNVVVCSYNIDNIPDIVLMFDKRKIKINKLTITHYMHRGNAYYHNELMFDVDKYARIVSKSLDYAKDIPYELTFRNFPICIDNRLQQYNENLNSIDIIDFTKPGFKILNENAPYIVKSKCLHCLSFNDCPKYLKANYGRIHNE